MTEAEQKQLVIDVLRDAKLNWWIDSAGGEDRIFAHISDLMMRFSSEYLSRYKLPIQPLTIFELYYKMRPQVRAFLQAVATTQNAKMLVMVWRIINGSGIKHMELCYDDRATFRFKVILESPVGAPDLFETIDIDDGALLRHLGIMKAAGKPVYHGFFALHLPDPGVKPPKIQQVPDAERPQLSQIRIMIETFLHELFARYLDLRKQVSTEALSPLSGSTGVHQIDLPEFLVGFPALEKVMTPINEAKSWVREWNQIVSQPNSLCLYHKERMYAYVGTCFAEALRQVDILESKANPKESSFGGRFYRKVDYRPWESY